MTLPMGIGTAEIGALKRETSEVGQNPPPSLPILIATFLLIYPVFLFQQPFVFNQASAPIAWCNTKGEGGLSRGCHPCQSYHPTPMPMPPPPPPVNNGEAIRVWCPLGPLVYAGCSAAASAASTGGTLGREALSAPWCPSTCPRYALGRGEPDPARVAARRQSRSAGLTPVVPSTTAFPCQQAVVERLGSLSL